MTRCIGVRIVISTAAVTLEQGRNFRSVICASSIFVLNVERTGIRNVMSHRHRRTHMRYHTIQLVNMKFFLVRQIVTTVAETFQREWGRNVTVDFLHAARKTFEMDDKQAWQYLISN